MKMMLLFHVSLSITELNLKSKVSKICSIFDTIIIFPLGYVHKILLALGSSGGQQNQKLHNKDIGKTDK